MEDAIGLFAPERQAGFRLQYLEVLNWGTFHKLRWLIQPNGYNALLTGDIGSGKSTLVDALTCLLVPHHKIVFNKAAGSEGKERDLSSYIKGEYKKEKGELTKTAKPVYLRPDNNTYTVIIGNFHNEGYREHVCLAQIFWIGSEGKVEKLLLIAGRPLTITHDFSGFTDINDLRKRLRRDETIQMFSDNFSKYSEQFRRLFGMNSDKAIDLFYQTVSMKSVSSLTQFVREQMLERTDVKDQVKTLLSRFEDLKKAHEAVVHAREQYEILKPLTQSCIEYGNVIRETEHIEAMLELSPAWFALQKTRLLTEAIEKTEKDLDKAGREIGRLSEEKTSLERKQLGISQDIANNGGNRIVQIEEERSRQEEDKQQKQKDYADYKMLAEKCGLPVTNNEQDFDYNTEKARQLDKAADQKETELRSNRDAVVTELRKEQTEYNVEQAELESLRARKSQIPGWLVSFRTQLCNDLRIDEEELPFAGELLKVAEQEGAWEGAIEKLLRDLGISLLVPGQHYQRVKNYVNDNPLRSADGKGIKLTFLEAGTAAASQRQSMPEADSVVYKIEIRQDTVFEEWLAAYLQDNFGNYLCVDKQQLERVRFGITPQGLIKRAGNRHTKDDRKSINDRRTYVLGWSNVEKIKSLESSLQRLEEKIAALGAEKNRLEEEEKANRALKMLLGHLLRIEDYSRINWQYHAEKIHELEQEKTALLHNNDTLALLRASLDKVEQDLRITGQEHTDMVEQRGALKKQIGQYKEQHAEANRLLEATPEAGPEKWFAFIQEKIGDVSFTLRNIGSRQDEFRRQFEGESGELKKLRTKASRLRSDIERLMRQIREHSKAEYSEISESIDARAEYIRKYELLTTEDLKRHEARFKEELNKNTINSIAVFDNQLSKHETEIREKIRLINKHLHEIVYNASQDTYITIELDTTSDKEVRLFKEDLKACYAGALSGNASLYSEEKYEQVKRILDRFASAEPGEKDWSSKVTDVRQWFEFNASERYRQDNAEKEFYEGSSGKSGGQKEKLAYTILASALAYQFGLHFGEKESRSFRFVAIDEAFGRGSDESTRYGLELFNKLNLQLLIVTPLQKIHVIEGHVNTFHFISNREGNNSQVSNFTKEAYAIERARRDGIFQQPVLSPS